MASFDFGGEVSYKPVSKDLDSIASHLDQAKALKLPEKRAVALIIGAAVTDAATRPFHWVYNRTVLESTIKDLTVVEFWPKSVSPFYTIPTGWRSCYNDESLVMLRTLNAVKDETLPFCRSRYYQELRKMFAPDGDYGQALVRRKIEYDPSSRRTEERQPVSGLWQQSAVTRLLQDLDEGRDDPPSGSPDMKESDGFCTCIPLIAKLAVTAMPAEEKDRLLLAASSLIASNAEALSHTLVAANLLMHLVNDESATTLTLNHVADVVSALQERQQQHAELYASLDFDVIGRVEVDQLHEAITASTALTTTAERTQHFVDTVEVLGKPCALPGSFLGGVLAPLVFPGDAVSAVRAVIRSGGCNCSKANLTGALLGALHGLTWIAHPDNEISTDEVLEQWVKRTKDAEEILRLAIDVVTSASK